MITSTPIYSAERQHGVCQGTLWLQQQRVSSNSSSASTSSLSLLFLGGTSTGGSTNSSATYTTANNTPTATSATTTTTTEKSSCDYCFLLGAVLSCYESRAAYRRGDAPTSILHVVGASAWNASSGTAMGSSSGGAAAMGTTTGTASSLGGSSDVETAFRLVSNQGTHVYGQAPNSASRDIWLAAFHTGLEQALREPTFEDDDHDQETNERSSTASQHLPSNRSKKSSKTTRTAPTAMIPPEPRRSVRPLRARRRHCVSCGALEGSGSSSAHTNSSTLLGSLSSTSSAAPTTSETASSSSATNKVVWPAAMPLPQYGREGRVDVCSECWIAQGLVDHCWLLKQLLEQAEHERQALHKARAMCWRVLQEHAQNKPPTTTISQRPQQTRATTTHPKAQPAKLSPPMTTTATTALQPDDHEIGSSPNRVNVDSLLGSSDPRISPAVAPDTSSSSSSASSPDSWQQVGVGGDASRAPSPQQPGGDDNDNTPSERPAATASAVSTVTGAVSKNSLSGSWLAIDKSMDDEEDPFDNQDLGSSLSWVHLPPTASSSKALYKCVQDAHHFGALARISPVLEGLTADLLTGRWSPVEFIKLLDQAVLAAGGKGGDETERLAVTLKKQAFEVAGDMGSAMKLLLDHALPRSSSSYASSNNLEVLTCILDFLLDLCTRQDDLLSSVRFFWPQLCQIHLRMLPAENCADLARVELVEDFLITVCRQHSIHLALELVWSHTADLEESIGNLGNGISGGALTTTTTCMDTCRRRRFAVLRFLCELESVLFDFDGGWGGGSVSLGKILTPTAHQVECMRVAMKTIQALRLKHPSHLSRSSRLDMLRTYRKRQQHRRMSSPEAAAQEKLRLTKNADYFSCHLNFTKRICDIAETLRFLELERRPSALEQELSRLNASGTMGGDPLNRAQAYLTRVVRVPMSEGHVFRSKERTPVLLLMEVVDEVQDMAMDASIASTASSVALSPSSERGSQRPEATIGSDLCSDLGTLEDVQASGLLAAEDVQASGLLAASSSAPDDATPTDPISPSAAAAGGIQILEGALDGCRPSPSRALKRFDSLGEGSSGQKGQVEQLVNSVVMQQMNLVLPNLQDNNDGGDDDPPQRRIISPGQDMPPDRKSMSPRDHLVQDDSRAGRRCSEEYVRRANVKKQSALGAFTSIGRETGDTTNTLSPTGDIRREVLNAIMMTGTQGNTIAAGAAHSVQRFLQDLERKRATELLLRDDEVQSHDRVDAASPQDSTANVQKTRQKLASLGLDGKIPESDIRSSRPSEEDEVMEAIRLLLIQNRVAQGYLSPADAAKVLQHVSLAPVNSPKRGGGDDGPVDMSELATVDAGDIDPRLVGCGPVPPAVLQALTLWKGGMVTNAELLELVKKDIEFVRHSVLLDAANLDKLHEDSAFWGRFSFGERWAEKKARIGSYSPHGSTPGWDLFGVIVKSNDDLRQEAFVMQLIELCKEAFEMAGLELWVNPYRILATGRSTGVIEMVRNAMSFDALKKRPGYGKGGLREHLQRMTEFTADPGEAFKSAQRNFVRSLAAYSLMSYFFLFKDRHNGNLLLDTAGHVIHIDFGFVFGVAPGGSFSLEMSTPFKLTEEMLDVMGGLRSPLFSEFVTLFCCGFLALQAHCDTFITIVEITSKDSTFKCFENRDTDDVITKLRERFRPDMSKEETVAYALDLIKQATTSYGTRQYDMFQYLSQGIAS